MMCVKREHVLTAVQIHGSVENIPGMNKLRQSEREWAIPYLRAVALGEEAQRLLLLGSQPAPDVFAPPARRAAAAKKKERSFMDLMLGEMLKEMRGRGGPSTKRRKS